jgi:hypothetical protein
MYRQRRWRATDRLRDLFSWRGNGTFIPPQISQDYPLLTCKVMNSILGMKQNNNSLKMAQIPLSAFATCSVKSASAICSCSRVS